MTVSGTQPPDVDAALRHACQQVGLQPRRAKLLRHFANAVFLVDGVVARVAYGPDAADRSARALAVTHWLTGLGFPATAPHADLHPGLRPVLAPTVERDVAVTFWVYHPQRDGDRPEFQMLGQLARYLHQVTEPPPVTLPRYQPLVSLLRVLATSAGEKTLDAGPRAWLTDRAQALAAHVSTVDSHLGTGLIHADLYAGNLLASHHSTGGTWLLGDWDSVCVGPREVDLAPTAVAARFGLDDRAISEVAEGYGFDVRAWPGFPILREIRELSTLSALIRLADTQPDSARELRLRVDSLINADTSIVWHRQ